MYGKFLASGAVFAFLGVVMGAFGAHILKNYLESNLLIVFETAVKYQMYHSLAMVVVAVLMKSNRNVWLIRSVWFFTAGIVIFSGSLYVLSLTGIKWFGALTPFGGIAFLAGWICLFMYALKNTHSKP